MTAHMIVDVPFFYWCVIWGALWLCLGVMLAWGLEDRRRHKDALAAIDALRQFVVDQPALDSLADVINARVGSLAVDRDKLADYIASTLTLTVDRAIKDRLPDNDTLRSYLREAFVFATMPKEKPRGKRVRRKSKARS